MLIPEFSLFDTYTNDLARTIRWLQRQSGAPQAIIDLVLYDTARELAHGRAFSTEKCDCGCGMEGQNTAIEHYMLKKVITLADENRMELLKAVEKSISERILRYMEQENQRFTESRMKEPTFMEKVHESKAIIFFILLMIETLYISLNETGMIDELVRIVKLWMVR